MAKLRIVWVKSSNGFRFDQKRTLRALGFHHLNEVLEKDDSAPIRGMIRKVQHLVKVEES